jgi:carbonic anhydrase
MKKQLSIFIIVLISSAIVLSTSNNHTNLGTSTNSNNNSNNDKSKNSIKTESSITSKSGSNSSIYGLKSTLLLSKSKSNLSLNTNTNTKTKTISQNQSTNTLNTNQIDNNLNSLSVLNFFNKEKTRIENQQIRTNTSNTKSYNNNSTEDQESNSFNYLLNRRTNTNSNSNNYNNFSQNKLKKQNKDTKLSKADLDRQSLVDLTVDNEKIIARTESTTTVLSGWLRIFSATYKNQKLFPEISLPNYSKKTIQLDEETNFRINDKFATDADYFKRYQFYFRLSNKNLYYSNDESSLNVLDSLPVKRIKAVEDFPLNNPEDALCFQIKDTEKISDWKLCAMDLKTVKQWGCMIKNLIGQIDQSCKERVEEIPEPTIINQTITQPILLIPQPSRQCNENWNYFKKGSDWECDCAEGKEQSPIDLPKASEAIPSPVKPIFQYEETGPKEVIKTPEGEEKSETYKMEYSENMIQINSLLTGDPQTGGFGKLITLDGSIYKATKIVFHTPSEHTIDGRQFAMEMQIIHNGMTKGDLAKSVVLSVLFNQKAGVYNRFIDSLDFFNLPKVTSNVVDLKSSVYIPKVLFESDSDDITVMKPVSFYTYQGSISFPPCNEKTINYVLSKPIDLSTTTIQLFKEAIRIPDYKDSYGNILINKEKAENNRATQPLNGRSVFYYDNVKYCGPEPEKTVRINKVEGHFEKVSNKITQYIYVNSDSPSGMPNSFVVDENEAKGLKV